jgi:guanylate kinase
MINKGIIFILSSPSGGGKSSIAKKLIAEKSDLWLSISCTTRQKRVGEVEGVDYYFIDQNKYLQMKQANLFLEAAQVYDHSYGTPKDVVFQKLSCGVDVLFDIDWQGAKSLQQIADFSVVSIFILPPSLAELRDRLIKRGDLPEFIERRMRQAKDECSHYEQYDYVVVNKDFLKTFDQVCAIIQAEKLSLKNQTTKTFLSQDFFDNTTVR